MQKRGPKSPSPRKAKSPDVNARVERAFEDGRVIDEAFQEAFRNAVLEHKAAGHPLVFSENGKTIFVSADEVEKKLNGRKKPRAKRPRTRTARSKKR
jgi:hypothetical protein